MYVTIWKEWQTNEEKALRKAFPPAGGGSLLWNQEWSSLMGKNVTVQWDPFFPTLPCSLWARSLTSSLRHCKEGLCRTA